MKRIVICTYDLLKRHLKINILFSIQIIITLFILTGFIGQVQYLYKISNITNTFNNCEAYYYYPYQSTSSENSAQKILYDNGITNAEIGDVLHMIVCVDDIPTGIIAYNSVTINFANLEIDSGKWLNQCKSDNRIPVISTTEKYKTGQILIITDIHKNKYEGYICGNIVPNTQILTFNKGSHTNNSSLDFFVSYPDADLIFPYECDDITSINDEFDLSKVYNAPSGRTGQIIISDKVLDYSYLYEIFHTFGSIANIKSMADTYNKNNKSNLIISGVVLLVFSILTVTGIGGINGVQNRINRKYFVIWYMLGTKTRDCAFIELLRVLAISLFSFIIYICIYYFTPLRENMNISSVYIDGFTFFTAFLFIVILCSITSMDYVIKLGKGNIISAYKNQN